MDNPSSVPELFSKVKAEKVFFQPIHGNLGDELIVNGIMHLAREQGVHFTDGMADADHLFIKGGGALLDVYPDLLAEFGQLFRDYSAVPTTFLPTSYLLNCTDMATLVGKRAAPLHIFARERYSYDLLVAQQFQGPVTIGLDHDTAFHLDTSEFLRDLKGKKSEKHILIVERIDSEALGNERAFTGPIPPDPILKSIVRRITPQSFRRFVANVRHAKPNPTQSTFAFSAHQRVLQDYPQFEDLPVVAMDVSHDKHCESMDAFATAIANSAVVYTSRLHVGILSAMLGIPTYLVEGVYHKIRGIYEYSMLDMPHVTLISN